MDAALVSQVRSFNRRVTQTIGALHDDYLGRDRPLGESRLLFEIGRIGATRDSSNAPGVPVETMPRLWSWPS